MPGQHRALNGDYQATFLAREAGNPSFQAKISNNQY